jgi:hypothetical protein
VRNAGLLRLRLFFDFSSSRMRRDGGDAQAPAVGYRIEKIFLLAPGTFRRGIMLVNFLIKVSKTLKMFRITRLN